MDQAGDKTAREARCTCGALSAVATGEPLRNSVCNCLACRRRSGSAFGWNAHWPEEKVRRSGEAASTTRSSEDGFWARFFFCPACGVTVWYQIERRPGIVSIPVGAFADPDFSAPTVEVYGEQRCAWLPELAAAQE